MTLGAAQIPNALTLLRLCAVPVILWAVVSERLALAFGLFAAAGLTDALDGFLAKRLDARTRLGAYLDPLADKALLVSLYVALGLAGHLALWLVGLVVARDLLILAAIGADILRGTPVRIAPSALSKLNTAAQIALAAFVLGALAFGIDAPGASLVGSALVAATTTLSGLAYARARFRRSGGMP